MNKIILFLLVVFAACTATREQEVEGDVNDFRNWVNTQTGQLAKMTEEDWKSTKATFKQRTEELDRKQENFSEKAKADYQEIKEDFHKHERERDQLSEHNAQIGKWEHDLLGQYADRSSVNEGNITKAYATFMENVRLRHKSWGKEDWEMAEQVVEELNDRKEALEELPDEDEVKIKALQMEFSALRKSEDVEGE